MKTGALNPKPTLSPQGFRVQDLGLRVEGLGFRAFGTARPEALKPCDLAS